MSNFYNCELWDLLCHLILLSWKIFLVFFIFLTWGSIKRTIPKTIWHYNLLQWRSNIKIILYKGKQWKYKNLQFFRCTNNYYYIRIFPNCSSQIITIKLIFYTFQIFFWHVSPFWFKSCHSWNIKAVTKVNKGLINLVTSQLVYYLGLFLYEKKIYKMEIKLLSLWKMLLLLRFWSSIFGFLETDPFGSSFYNVGQ